VGGFIEQHNESDRGRLSLPSRDPDAHERTREISALYVEPAEWRGGAGTALMQASLAEAARRGGAGTAPMQASLAEAARRGGADVTLWVFEPNVRARAFYDRRGFTDDGSRQTAGDGWPVELRMRRAV
jgi:GNAT superfamily N-acetyltransferase